MCIFGYFFHGLQNFYQKTRIIFKFNARYLKVFWSKLCTKSASQNLAGGRGAIITFGFLNSDYFIFRFHSEVKFGLKYVIQILEKFSPEIMTGLFFTRIKVGTSSYNCRYLHLFCVQTKEFIAIISFIQST